jgi:hypothetical protein
MFGCVAGPARAADSAKSTAGNEAAASDKPKGPQDTAEIPGYSQELAELLRLIDPVAQKQDPATFVEVELGRFKLTRSQMEGERIVDLNFHLFAVVPEGSKSLFAERLPLRQQRLRDLVLTTLHQASDEEINEPSLLLLRQRLIVQLNRVLETLEIRDIAFSEFSSRYQ